MYQLQPGLWSCCADTAAGLTRWKVPREVLRGRAGDSVKVEDARALEKIWTKHKIMKVGEHKGFCLSGATNRASIFL